MNLSFSGAIEMRNFRAFFDQTGLSSNNCIHACTIIDVKLFFIFRDGLKIQHICTKYKVNPTSKILAFGNPTIVTYNIQSTVSTTDDTANNICFEYKTKSDCDILQAKNNNLSETCKKFQIYYDN